MVDICYVTSCYNGEQFLDGLIENQLQQFEVEFEHIIVDSKSTDGSVAIVKRWQREDPRIRLIEQPERTPYGVSWLVGWQQARSNIVTNSNVDDRSYPWRGLRVKRAFEQARLLSESPYSFYYGGYITRADGLTIAKVMPPPYAENDLQQFFRCGIHVHWDNHLRDTADWKTMFRAAEEYRSAFDYWLVLYFMSLGARGCMIPSVLSVYNLRDDSLEWSDKERSDFEAMRAIQTFYPNSPVVETLEQQTKHQSPGCYRRYREFLREFGE